MKPIVIANLSYEWVQKVKANVDGVVWPDDPDEWLRSPSTGSGRKLVFFVHWSHRVPTSILDAYECVNFHCTPLPYGRGGHPIENMIRLGYEFTSMTAHRMVKGLDAGPIYLQWAGIPLDGTKAEILDRFVVPVSAQMRDIIEDPDIVPIDQAKLGRPTFFNRLTPDEYADFWAKRLADDKGGVE